MKFTPVMQTKLIELHGSGNCFAACLSSVTGIPLEDFPEEEFLPNFALIGFWQMLADFFYQRDIQVNASFIELGSTTPMERPLVTLGRSPRYKDLGHACIYNLNRAGLLTMRHDPHPSGRGNLHPHTFIWLEKEVLSPHVLVWFPRKTDLHPYAILHPYAMVWQQGEGFELVEEQLHPAR